MMADVPSNPTNECAKCGHDLKNPADETKEHTEQEGVLLCRICMAVCRMPTAAPTPAPAPPVVATPPQNTEDLARAVAAKVGKLRDEMIWKSLQQPGVIVQVVDGGLILENRWGEVCVRADVEQALARVREWLQPR